MLSRTLPRRFEEATSGVSETQKVLVLSTEKGAPLRWHDHDTPPEKVPRCSFRSTKIVLLAASRRFDSFQISDFWSQSGASKTQKVLVLSTEKEGAKAAIRAQLLPGITDAMQSECFNSMFLQLLYHESHTKVSCFIANTYKTHSFYTHFLRQTLQKQCFQQCTCRICLVTLIWCLKKP